MLTPHLRCHHRSSEVTQSCSGGRATTIRLRCDPLQPGTGSLAVPRWVTPLGTQVAARKGGASPKFCPPGVPRHCGPCAQGGWCPWRLCCGSCHPHILCVSHRARVGATAGDRAGGRSILAAPQLLLSPHTAVPEEGGQRQVLSFGDSPPLVPPCCATTGDWGGWGHRSILTAPHCRGGSGAKSPDAPQLLSPHTSVPQGGWHSGSSLWGQPPPCPCAVVAGATAGDPALPWGGRHPWVLGFGDSHPHVLDARVPSKCPEGTCDGCTFHLLWVTAEGCPRCSAGHFRAIVGACQGGLQVRGHRGAVGGCGDTGTPR